MRLKIKEWETKAEEVRGKTELLYEEYLRYQREHNHLQQSLTKGELLWTMINGADTGAEYQQKMNVSKQRDKLKALEEKISAFKEMYLRTEEMQYYMQGVVTADTELLHRSYKQGNMDAAFLWGMVELQSRKDNQYKEALEALKQTAASKTIHAWDAKIVLAQYYEKHALTEAINLKETEDELNMALRYYEEVVKEQPKASSEYEHRQKAVKSLLKCYAAKIRSEHKLKSKNKFVRLNNKVALVLATVIMTIFAAALVEVVVASVKHGFYINFEDPDELLLQAEKVDTVVQGKYAIALSEKNVFLGDLIPMIPLKKDFLIQSGRENENKASTYLIKEGTTKVNYMGWNDIITKVELPDSVTTIEAEAFSDWGSLETVKLSEQINDIGEYAFSNCVSLKSITLPDSLTAINANTFIYCSNLSKVKLPDQLTSIGEDAFYGCTAMKKISLPDTITEIGQRAFDDTSLKSIILPYGIKTIAPENFSNLKKIYVDKREYDRYKDYFVSEAKVVIMKKKGEK